MNDDGHLGHLRAYLDVVDHLPPVGEHQARELGHTIQRGNQAGSRLEGGTLSGHEASEARRLKEQGYRARKQLVEGNLRFVVTVADDYRDRGLPHAELLEAGNIGLVRAVDRYDWQQDSGFTSAAISLIREAITTAIRDRESPT